MVANNLTDVKVKSSKPISTNQVNLISQIDSNKIVQVIYVVFYLFRYRKLSGLFKDL